MATATLINEKEEVKTFVETKYMHLKLTIEEAILIQSILGKIGTKDPELTHHFTIYDSISKLNIYSLPNILSVEDISYVPGLNQRIKNEANILRGYK